MIVVTITVDDSQQAKEIDFSVLNTKKGAELPNPIELANYIHHVEGRLLGMLSVIPRGNPKPEEPEQGEQPCPTES